MIKKRNKFITVFALIGLINGCRVVNALEGEIIKNENINMISISNIKSSENNIDKNILKNINEMKDENADNRFFISSIRNIYREEGGYLEEEKNNMIAANIVNAQDESEIFNPYIVKEINGIEIGIIGIYRNIIDIDNKNEFIMKDEVESINKYTQQLKDKGINNIIVLSDIPAITNEEGLTYIDEHIDIHDIYNDLDEEVDIIISENNLNNGSSSIQLNSELGSLELVRCNIEENYLIDMNMYIDEENDLKVSEVSFLKENSNIDNNDIDIPEENFEYKDSNDLQDEIVDKDMTSEFNSYNELNLQARVVGGSDKNENNTDGEVEQRDEDKEDEEDKDSDNKEDEIKDREEVKKTDDENSKSKSNLSNEVKNKSNLNPKTSDSSIGIYIITSMTCVLGLGLNNRKRK